MLMAAGLGTRLKPFTDMEPKPLLPLMGIPTAQFAVDALVAAGVRKIVANVHHLPARAVAGLSALDLGGAVLAISDESDLLLGSAGGMKKARTLLGDGPFFLLNSDVLCDVNLEALALQHAKLRKKDGVMLTLAIFPRATTGGRYKEILFDTSTDLITGLGGVVMDRPFFIGAAIIEPDALTHVPDRGPADFVSTILAPAIAEKKAGVFLSDGVWQDVGSPDLWIGAHVELIRLLETGKLDLRWKKRIESANKRVGELIWVSKDCPKQTRMNEWVGPCYWSPQGDTTALPPKAFGPRSVAYGPAGSNSAKSGISMRGVWVGSGTATD